MWTRLFTYLTVTLTLMAIGCRSCVLNQCEIPNLKHCFNGGTCLVDSEICTLKCECSGGFKGSRCELQRDSEMTVDKQSSTATTMVSHSESISLRPLDQRQCYGTDVVCVHGYCSAYQAEQIKTKCLCDDGWTGKYCNKPASSDNERTTASDYSTQNHGSTATVSACSNDYSIRPVKERTCLSNFVCKYGRCEKETMPDKLILKCICDPGSVGHFCAKKCCKNCSDHGLCRNIRNSEFCSCNVGYFGPQCEHKKLNETSSEQNQINCASCNYKTHISESLTLLFSWLLLCYIVK